MNNTWDKDKNPEDFRGIAENLREFFPMSTIKSMRMF